MPRKKKSKKNYFGACLHFWKVTSFNKDASFAGGYSDIDYKCRLCGGTKRVDYTPTKSGANAISVIEPPKAKKQRIRKFSKAERTISFDTN